MKCLSYARTPDTRWTYAGEGLQHRFDDMFDGLELVTLINGYM